MEEALMERLNISFLSNTFFESLTSHPTAAPTSAPVPPPSSFRPPPKPTSTSVAPLSAPPLASTLDSGDENESSHLDELDDL
ncbi:hypothetical protein Syun_029442 [Stephania yunnanensis]|uniref:Uncharacterized protein n=1 Tax=Stephania yunnanensis TaxID=152371 RepID=A0AAP0E8L6_9MAGN